MCLLHVLFIVTKVIFAVLSGLLRGEGESRMLFIQESSKQFVNIIL